MTSGVNERCNTEDWAGDREMKWPGISSTANPIQNGKIQIL